MTAPLDRSATTAAATAGLLLPEGTCLLHIGPPKTGTTSLQAAFWAARREALAQGVRYAGWSRHSSRATQAVASGSPRASRRAIRQWEALADEVRRAAEPRVVLSSEHLSYAQPASIRRIIGDLGRRPMHVVVTLRPLHRILPSRWQEYAKDGLAESYEVWLEAMLDRPPGRITPTFWQQQRHDALVGRWAEAVGAERISVIVVDEQDRDGLLRTFERLTGLRTGTLVPVEDLSNRSLTQAEVEAVQALTRLLRAEGFTSRRIDEVVRATAARHLLGRRPDLAESTIETPTWARERIGEIAREMVAGIASSGARVVGDLESLALPAADRTGPGGAPLPAPTAEIAAWLAYGMYLAGRRDVDPRSAGRRLVWGAMLRLPPSVVGRLRALRPK